ncbi:MAG: TrkH family potassium uptake protein [Brevinemataceae bacterium]
MQSIIFLFQFLSIVRITILGIAIFVLIQGVLEMPISYLPLVINLTLFITVIHLISEIISNKIMKNSKIMISVFSTVFWLIFINTSHTYIFMIDNSLKLQPLANSITLFVIAPYFYQNLRNSFAFFAKLNLNSRWIITLSFLLVIIFGTALLLLPMAIKPHKPPISVIDAFFTAVSAVCVTGLTVLDTATYFSRFGQIIILILIQIGSLGLVGITTVFISLLGQKLSLAGQLSARDSTSGLMGANSLIYYLGFTLGFTLLIEAVIALLLFFKFSTILPLGEAIFFSIFHAVSAFCNAGFSLYSDSLVKFGDDLLINIPIMLAIIIGGLGFGFWLDINSRYLTKETKHLRLQNLIIIRVSTALILLGTFLFYIFEKEHVLNDLTLPQQILRSLFASVNMRTAGFNTIDLASTTESSRLLSMILMYIGASPGSTGGGIKTTSFMVLLATIISNMSSADDEVIIFGKQISKDIVIQTWVLLSSSLIWIFFVALSICHLDKVPLSDASYETVSAFATVGLSTGITPKLHIISKILISITMIIGRIGPTTVMLAFSGRKTAQTMLIRTPSESLSIG